MMQEGSRWLLASLLLPLGLCACDAESPSPCSGVSCSSRGFCLDDQGDAYCACISWYHPEGLACVANDSANPCQGIACSGHGTCVVDGSSPTCECFPGYRHIESSTNVCDEAECDLVCVPAGSSDGGETDADVTDEAETVSCTPADIQCVDGTAYVCNSDGDGWASATACAGTTPLCVPGLGCAACEPGTLECAEETAARVCLADGSGWSPRPCDTALGETCVGDGLCTDLSAACVEALATTSNEACDFWATQTVNSGLMPGSLAGCTFGFEISNRRAVAANVLVLGPTGSVASTTVGPNRTGVITLGWNDALRVPAGSALVPGAAYRVKSDVPVTVVQFNPLEYWGGTTETNSYSNDASLLLPRHALTGNYMIVSRPTFMMRQDDGAGGELYSGYPGFLVVVGISDDTRVDITFTANTQAGTAAGGLAAYAPGDTGSFTLDRFDVLQLLTVVPETCTVTVEHPRIGDPSVIDGFCAFDPTYDLTGSIVAADKPVAVFGGHDCGMVPYDRYACDHLEDQLPPLEAWGVQYVGARTQPIGDEANVWRVISREDGNRIRFRPDIWTPTTLDRGEYLELETPADLVFEGDAPFLAVQFLAGQGEVLESIGDPSMSIAVPVAQYRTEYGFFAPEAFRDDPATGREGQSWLNVTAPTGAALLLDGSAVTGLTPIGTLGFDVARVPLTGGPHVITSTVAFGITLYGYGNYVSYATPGGTNLDPISPLP